jgi:centrosomal protein CEP104
MSGDLQQEASYSSMSVGPYGGGVYGTSNKHTAYDERPAQGRGRYTPSEDATRSSIQGLGPTSPNGGGSGGAGLTQSQQPPDIPAPDGWPADLPHPEPLTGV